MGESAQHARELGPAGEARTFWRRRFFILLAGLAAFALLAWGLSVAFNPGSGIVTGTGGQRGTGTTGGGPAGGPGSQAATGAPAAASATPTAAGGQKAGASPSASGRPSGAAINPPYCARRNIVLSLTPGQAVFGAGQPASFSVSVVSTAPADCSFNLGRGYLAIVVSEGPVRIWGSADCVRGAGTLLTALRRGVPTILQITWNRRTSSPGCGGPVNQVPSGTYTAQATQGNLTSSPVTFRLG